MPAELVILGAGGWAREVCTWMCESWSLPPKVVFAVDPEYASPPIQCCGREYQVISDWNFKESVREFIPGVGYPDVKRKLIKKAREWELVPFKPIIHPKAHCAPDVNMALGCVIGPGAIIGSGVHLGRCVTIGPGCIIGHDVVIEESSTCMPGSIISGNCWIKSGVCIGAGAVLREKVVVGHGSVIGAQAGVICDCIDDGVYVGVPALSIGIR